MQVWGKHFWGCRTLERSSVGPTRGKYTSRTVVLKATPASIWVWLASALNSRRAKKIAPTRRLSGQADTPRKRCQKIGPSGRRPNPKAVVSAMPVVMPKARARIAHVVIAAPLFYLCGDCQNRAMTSVTAITFWSFLEQQSQPNASSTPEKEKGHQFGGLYRTVIPRPVLGLTP